MQSIAESLRRLEVTGPAWVGGTIVALVDGEPGEIVLLLVSLAPDGEAIPALGGTLVGKPPLVAGSLGVLPSSGSMVFSTVLPSSLPHGLHGVEVYEHCVVAGSNGSGILGSPSITAILAP